MIIIDKLNPWPNKDVIDEFDRRLRTAPRARLLHISINRSEEKKVGKE